MFEQSSIIPSVEALQLILDSLPNPVFVVDRDHRLVLINQAMCAFAGRPREAMIGQTGRGLVPQEQLDVFWKIDDKVFATGEPNENEETITDAHGEQHIVVTRKRMIHLDTKHGRTPLIVAVLSDVTRFREAEARADYLAGHDTLTGLPNRSRFDQRLGQALEDMRRQSHAVSLLLLDLDGFKPVNDRFGHMVGDDVLRIVGKRLSGLLRSTDVVARFGGDEFCIIQTGIQGAEDALTLARRVVGAIGQPIAIDPEPLAVSASIGVAIAPEDADDPELLLECADQALYAVKRNGRCGYCRYDPTIMRPPAPTVIGPRALEGDAPPSTDPALASGPGRPR